MLCLICFIRPISSCGRCTKLLCKLHLIVEPGETGCFGGTPATNWCRHCYDNDGDIWKKRDLLDEILSKMNSMNCGTCKKILPPSKDTINDDNAPYYVNRHGKEEGCCDWDCLPDDCKRPLL